ncbi:histidine kinase dimerization/phosphoacceptor domain-containing protein [Kitasatospora sp. NBC_00070]|uniref:histidine kinase dimerization/phosphoacceptor domain-containing protein n=1 Tax=Kitasatospora sp. NBC_00070 TaxID=2975962 RepID=UPI00324E9AF4
MYRLHAWFLRRPGIGDGAWAMGLFLLGWWAAAGRPGPVGPPQLGCLAVGCGFAVLMLVRRRHPGLAVLGGIALGFGQLAVGAGPGPLQVGCLVLARWAGCFGSPRVALAALAGALAVGPLAVARGLADGGLGSFSAGQLLLVSVTYPVPFLLCWAWGLWSRARRAELAALADRAATARAALAREAVRARMAEELHDVITHDLTAMTVQAGGARYVLPVNPRLAGEAVHGIGDQGRRVLTELARLERVLSS